MVSPRERHFARKWWLLALSFWLTGCRDATQVQLELTTDALCADVRETSITVSSTADLETTLPDTTTDHCSVGSGRIGSLTLVPTDSDSAAFAVRTVLGLGKSAEDCVKDGYRGGCIVARRSLRFIPHRTLHIPMKMEVICKDVPCGATETCKNGQCVDATIANPNDCANSAGCDVAVGGASGAPNTSGTGGASQGGTAASGGTLLAGGTTSTGGSIASGGSVAQGGSIASGGVAGSVSVGGAIATGGTTGAAGSMVAGAAGLPAVCGDAILNPYAGEFCDTGGNSVSCNSDCWPTRCGDGVLDAAAGEQCDGSTTTTRCTPSCRLSTCGDGFVDFGIGEECELGLGGCNDCKQDRTNPIGALSVESVRKEPAASSLAFDVVVSNVGAAVPANELSFRYYFTADASGPQVIACTFADLGCGNVTLTTKQLKVPCAVATHYAEGVITATSNLTPFSILEVEGQVQGNTGSTYDFTNDYSRPLNTSGYLPTRLITLYRQSKLVWGIPPCGCGNGTLDSGEACDHAGESAFCNADCTLASCGDGKLNATAGETCDEGRASLTCSPTCRATGLPSSAKDALLLWLDPAQPTSITKGRNVLSLADLSGNTNAFGQTQSSRQPLWFPKAFGNLPGIFFDGIAHDLGALTPVNDLGRGSVFVVHRVEPVGISATLLANGWASSGGGFALRTRPQLDGLGLSLGASSGYAAVQWSIGARSGNGPPTPGISYWAWNPPLFSWARGTDSEALSLASTYGTTTAALRLGGINASEPFRGWIGEVLLFNRDMTMGERDAIFGYLRAKWGLP